MDEEILINNLTIGIWTINDDGIIAKPLGWPEGNIGKSLIWKRDTNNNETVWELPFHLASKPWVTPKDLKDLIEISAIHRRLWPIRHHIEEINNIDEKTSNQVLSELGKRKD